MTTYFALFAGIILLFLGGEFLVNGSVRLAEQTGLSKSLIAVIVMGFGTSAPELVVSIEAALDNLPQIALGNVVGSNLSNTLLIVGIAALSKPLYCKSQTFQHDALAGVLAALLLCFLGWYGFISRMTGAFLFIILCTYLFHCIWQEKRKSPPKIRDKIKKTSTFHFIKALITASTGLFLLIIGAHLLVQSAVIIAKILGISDAVIGLTLVAVGTSLPELFAVIVSAYRNQSEMILGNLLGSNLFNILSIIGLTALVKPIPFKGQIANQDVWLMLVSSVLLLLIIYFKHQITRLTGGAFLGLYLLYLIFLYSQGKITKMF